MSKIQVIMCPADRAPYVCWVQNSEDVMQKLLGGRIYTEKLTEKTIIVYHEELQLPSLPENNSLPVSGFRGDCFLCGVEGDQLVSLDEETKRRLLRSCRDRWNAIWEERHGN